MEASCPAMQVETTTAEYTEDTQGRVIGRSEEQGLVRALVLISLCRRRWPASGKDASAKAPFGRRSHRRFSGRQSSGAHVGGAWRKAPR